MATAGAATSGGRVSARLRRARCPWALGALALALALAQRPGSLVADTKVNLYLEPWRFLQDVMSAWSPTSDLGHVWAGQYGGYLFPMAPFFALGKAAGLPMWLTQRLWIGMLLALAAWGMVRLLDSLLAQRRGAAQLVAGALYVVNPYVTVYLGRTSITLLAYAALPWLMLAVHRGLRDARSWRWPAVFALVLTCTGGGVNVAVTGWALLGPLALLAHEWIARRADRRTVAVFVWRTVAVTLVVNLWWLLPVLVHNSYGLDFLPFTEQPGTIWQTTSISESLRLMGFWTSYIGTGFGGRLYPYAGHGEALLFNKGVVMAGLLVPALALGSFAWTRRRPYVPFLVGLTLAGVLLMSAGWPDGTPLRRGLTFTYNHVEALQFLRTTYKAGSLTALGLAALGGIAFARLWERLRSVPARALAALAAIVVAGIAAWPLTSGRAPDRQLVFDVPSAYEQVAADLDRRGDGSRALLEPGQLFAFSTWGGTIDSVLPALTERPVATRNVTPFSDLRAVDLQWTVDDLIGQGRSLPGQLPALLDLMGVGDVVVAADQDRGRGGGAGVLETLDALRLDPAGAKDYGPEVVARPAAGRIAATRRVPEVQRFELHTGGLMRQLAGGPQTIVDGGAGGLAELAAFGALDPSRPFAYAADLSAGEIRAQARAGATVVMTDSNRRQAFVASRLTGNRGAVLLAGVTVSEDGTMLDPFPASGSDAQTVAVFSGIASATMPFSPQVTQFPEHRPAAALDGDPSTFWLADAALAAGRRRLDIRFDSPRDVPWIDLTPYSDARGTVRSVIVAGREVAVRPGVNRIELGLHGVSGLSIAMGRVDHPAGGSFGVGGIRELAIPGVVAHEALRGPVVASHALRGTDLRRTTLVYQLSRVTADQPGRRGAQTGPAQERLVRDAQDPERRIDRLLDVPATRTWRVEAWTSVAQTTPDEALDRLAGTTGNGSAHGSARFDNLPGDRASGAFDGRASTAWIGQWVPGRSAWIAWRTDATTSISTLRLGFLDAHVRRPTRVRLVAGSRSAEAAVGADGTVALPRTLRGRAFRLEILAARFPAGTTAREKQRRAVAIAEIEGAGLALDVPRSGTVRTACGAAAIATGTHTVALRASGSIADLDDGEPLKAVGCGTLSMAAGRTELRGLDRTLTVDHLRLASAAPQPVKTAATGPRWLVYGQSYDRGWRATCDGRDLGSPRPMQGYANAWPIDHRCTDVSFTFAPDRVLTAGYIVSAVAIVVLLSLLGLRALSARRRRKEVSPGERGPADPAPRAGGRASPTDAVIGDAVRASAADAAAGDVVRASAGRLPDADSTSPPPGGTAVRTMPDTASPDRRPDPASPDTVPWTRALTWTIPIALAIAFVFAIRAGLVALPIVFLILWRAVDARRLALVAGALLAVGVPIAYLASPWNDHGGFNSNYAVDHRYGHWVAVAAVCLLALSLARTLRRGDGS